MRRHGMTAQRAVGDRRRAQLPGGRLEGVALHLPLASGRAPRRGRAAAHRPGRGRPPDPHRLGQPPDRRRAGRRSARRTPTSRSAPGSAPTCGSATAQALRVTATVLDVHPLARGDVFGYRGRSAPARRPPAGRQRRHRARHRPRGAARARPGSRPRAAIVARGGLDALGLHPLAVLGRRQAAALRRAAAHAGLDAVPARRRARCPRSATWSTRGCATPRRRSTASTSAEAAVAGAGRVVPRVAARRGPPSPRGRARRASGSGSRPSTSTTSWPSPGWRSPLRYHHTDAK